MTKLRKVFGEIDISWKFLIIFSIILGIGVGILNRIPILENTSFQDIAIILDMWIILAIFIIVNCKSAKDAVVKCFIFFLISQPLIYFTELLIETIFHNANFKEIFILYFKNYYIGAGWLTMTILTIPGSFIAYQIKKDNILSAVILSVATCYLGGVGMQGLIKTFTRNFPYHLLNNLICLVMSYILIFTILKNKKPRILATILTTISVFVGITFAAISTTVPVVDIKIIEAEDGTNFVECYVEDENIAKAEIEEDGACVYVSSSIKVGTTNIKIIDQNRIEHTYTVNIDSKEFSIMEKNKNE